MEQVEWTIVPVTIADQLWQRRNDIIKAALERGTWLEGEREECERLADQAERTGEKK